MSAHEWLTLAAMVAVTAAIGTSALVGRQISRWWNR